MLFKILDPRKETFSFPAKDDDSGALYGGGVRSTALLARLHDYSAFVDPLMLTTRFQIHSCLIRGDELVILLCQEFPNDSLAR